MQVCGGLYVVEVQLFDYNNPTGTCQGCPPPPGSDGRHSCCDDLNSFDQCDRGSRFRLCDSYFIYCLRPLGSDGEGCSNYRNRTSTGNDQDDPQLDFSQSVVLGLENPLVLEGSTETYESVSHVLLSVVTDML